MPTFSLSSPETLSPRSSHDLSDDDRPLWQRDKPYRNTFSRLFSTKSTLYQSRRSIAVIFVFAIALFVWFAPPPSTWGRDPVSLNLPHSPIRTSREQKAGQPDPVRWLRENGNDKHAVTGPNFSKLMQSSKPRAALISLVRNQELDGIIQSMTQLEYHWNHKYQYPWIFFNDEPFNEEFKVCCCPPFFF